MSPFLNYYWFSCFWIHSLFLLLYFIPFLLFFFIFLPFHFEFVSISVHPSLHPTWFIFQPFALSSFHLCILIPVLFPSISLLVLHSVRFLPAVVGSKLESDGCNPILQIQQKWWLGCSLSFNPLISSHLFRTVLFLLCFIHFFFLNLSVLHERHIWQDG